MKFVNDERGITGNIVGVIVVLAVLMLSVLILAPLQDQAEEQITKLGDENVNSTWSDIKDAMWGSMTMFTIVPYVIVFVVIIGLILAIGGRGT